MPTTLDRFDLSGRVAVITGGAGLLGRQHAAALTAAGAAVVLADQDGDAAVDAARQLARDGNVIGMAVDVTDKAAVEALSRAVVDRFDRVDILINNAALTVKGGGDLARDYFAAFEDYPLELWERALKVNLTGAFLCCQAIGKRMAAQGRGVILNIASDVGTISPDHRIYEGVMSPHTGLPFNTPASYATAKAGLINLTRYLATYWAKDGVRVNALSPGGVFTDHDPVFVRNLSERIPLGRMAGADEYQGAVLFLVSDASSYMTGANLIVDGGRTAW
ncbi:MAG TPA: SDR family oxidoreductase [Vicinamibacterales bacterium]|nr:SDR family oxidoreductase [Vicinamibacterales bacterium]